MKTYKAKTIRLAIALILGVWNIAEASVSTVLVTQADFDALELDLENPGDPTSIDYSVVTDAYVSEGASARLNTTGDKNVGWGQVVTNVDVTGYSLVRLWAKGYQLHSYYAEPAVLIGGDRALEQRRSLRLGSASVLRGRLDRVSGYRLAARRRFNKLERSPGLVRRGCSDRHRAEADSGGHQLGGRHDRLHDSTARRYAVSLRRSR